MDSKVGKRCHLLALPPELRNRIYEYVFVDEAPPAIDVLEVDLHWPSAALSGTCQQICQETIKIMSAAVVQFATNHTCIIEMGPFLEGDNYRTRLLERFSGTAYSGVKLQGLERRIGNGDLQSTRTVISGGVHVITAPTMAVSLARIDPLMHQRHATYLAIISVRIQEHLPRLTARRWREHCRDAAIPEGHMEYEDSRTWDIKDIVHLMYRQHDVVEYRVRRWC
ncbi:hypothetical protein LTR56_009161 [Elasticomyces elasticus]|nr:hypothetical protein LTR56_009161 [Elasticomyces elasticus]KAK3660602.1 hypothetical protein LTR22_007849 [Elasticomyces elasticus]KAK4915595.1 hypothetical protein LTR49_016318 [Elasticomyces elasticus]KAK5755039.1 hypothetical protein LTS12_014839 [Elasticomyces elasticus]